MKRSLEALRERLRLAVRVAKERLLPDERVGLGLPEARKAAALRLPDEERGRHHRGLGERLFALERRELELADAAFFGDGGGRVGGSEVDGEVHGSG